MAYVLLAVAISFEIVATLALRWTVSADARWWVWIIVVVSYGSSFTALQQALARGLPVAIAYAIWAAVGVAAITVLSWVLYRETLAPVQIGGIALVIVGVVMLELGGR